MRLKGQVVHGVLPILPRQRCYGGGPQVAHLRRGKHRPLSQTRFDRRAVALHTVAQKAELLLRLGRYKRLIQIILQLAAVSSITRWGTLPG